MSIEGGMQMPTGRTRLRRLPRLAMCELVRSRVQLSISKPLAIMDHRDLRRGARNLRREQLME